MALVTLHMIFQDALPAYAQRHAVPAHVRRAAHALMPRRTAALGGHVQAGPDGPRSRLWYTSCRPRSGPPWASLPTERW
jgi:transposase-like zinc-binding protein